MAKRKELDETKATNNGATAVADQPITDAESKLRAIRIQNEASKAKKLTWDAAKEAAADAKKDFDESIEILMRMIDDSPQGELFTEVARETVPGGGE